MTTTDYLETVAAALKAEGLDARIADVLKNGEVIQGITVVPDGADNCISPTFYEPQLKELGERGGMEEIVRVIKEHLNVPEDISGRIGLLMDRDYVLGQVRFRMVKAGTEAAYADYPHFMWEDIPVIYNVELQPGASANINRGYMESVGLTEEELYKAAFENTKNIFEEDIRNMKDVLSGFYGSIELPEGGPMMQVIGSGHTHGAAAIIVLKDIIEKLVKENGCISLIPSSTNEWILVNGGEDRADVLNQMIQEINVSSVVPEEWLSDHAYMMDRDLQILHAVNGEWVKAPAA